MRVDGNCVRWSIPCLHGFKIAMDFGNPPDLGWAVGYDNCLEFVVLHTTSIKFSWSAGFGVCLEVVVEIWTKNICVGSFQDQTRFGMGRGAKLSMSLKWTERMCSKHSKSSTTSEDASQVEIVMEIVVGKTTKWTIIGDQLLTISRIELKDNSIMVKNLQISLFFQSWHS